MNLNEVICWILGAIFFGFLALRDQSAGRSVWMYVSLGLAGMNYLIAAVEFLTEFFKK